MYGNPRMIADFKDHLLNVLLLKHNNNLTDEVIYDLALKRSGIVNTIIDKTENYDFTNMANIELLTFLNFALDIVTKHEMGKYNLNRSASKISGSVSWYRHTVMNTGFVKECIVVQSKNKSKTDIFIVSKEKNAKLKVGQEFEKKENIVIGSEVEVIELGN
ncbi:MAG: hypothetical protein FWH54_00310 [Methanobrevibacter sp.]|nr:hypothetical protein [Methanobrevibacter sp.]